MSAGWSGAGTPGPVGPEGPAGPAGSAPTGTLAAIVTALRVVALLSGGLTQHDGTQASAEAIGGGGFCVTGGSAAASVTYYPSGSKPTVGATGWTQGVPLVADATGALVTRAALAGSGVWTREIGIYSGTVLGVNIGPLEYIS